MGWLNSFFIASLLWVFFISSTHELQAYQNQLLLQLRKHLEYPSMLDVWENYNGDLCNLGPGLRMSMTCQDNLITELNIMGDRLVKVSEFNGFPIPNLTLSSSFSIDSLVTTLTRLTSLKVLSLVSLGIWGPLPDKIHRLYSLEFLDLGSNFLFGSVPSQMSRLVKLNTLTLDGNYFNGTVPDWLDSMSNLTILSFKSNRFTGGFPRSLCRLTSLVDIALSHNQLSGRLPDLGTIRNLHVLDLRENRFDSELPVLPGSLVTVLLNNNSFSGNIPEQFGEINQLQHLDLSLNHLTGAPPSSLFSLPNISYLNLASNKLSGSLPRHLDCGTKLGYVDISTNMLIGEVPSCLISGKRVLKFRGNCLSVNPQDQHKESFCKEANIEGKKHSRARAVGILLAVIGGAVVTMSLLALAVIFLCRGYCSRRTSEQNIFSKAVQDNTPTGVSSELLANARFISQAAKLGTQGTTLCHVFSLEELKQATNNFDSLTFMGEGSAGKIYRGRLENGTYVAIRSLSLLKKHSIQNLRVRLELLSKLHHPHLVGLLGYCIESSGQDDPSSMKVFVIYEYVPNGNYRNHLSEHCPEKQLNWSARLAILIGIAKAVHFLHAGMIPGTINNRLKTNNILLDEHRIAKLSNYGLSILSDEADKVEAKGDGPK